MQYFVGTGMEVELKATMPRTALSMAEHRGRRVTSVPLVSERGIPQAWFDGPHLCFTGTSV
eukprot:2039001-Amphidinium_carterae.1